MAAARRPKPSPLSRREREMMDILYANGPSTAAEILERMASPPSYSAVRATLRVLEEKGHLRHKQDGPRYVYQPTVSRERARESALKHVMQTFFEGSAESMVATLLDMKSTHLDDDEIERLREMIEAAREEGR